MFTTAFFLLHLDLNVPVSAKPARGSMEAHLQEEADHDLQLWYRQLHPVKLDIVGDFAGKELFAIHGESLVSHCVSQAQVDFGSEFYKEAAVGNYICSC